MLPLDLTSERVHRSQHAYVVIVHAFDAEALAQISSPFLVGDFFSPVVFFPVVGGNVEQASILAVSHRVPVLAAQEARSYFNGFAPGLAFSNGWWTLTFSLDWAAALVDTFRPGDVVDERKTLLEFAVGAVHHIEKAVAVGVGRGFDLLSAFGVLKQYQLVVAGEVPGIVGGMLVEPFHLAGGWVYANLS